MATPVHNSDLQRRKEVRLRARANLQFTPQIQGGRRVYVVKDPISLRYFHLDEAQRFTLQHMDGQRTLESIQRAFEREFKPERISLEELEAYGSYLLQCGLVESEAPGAGQLVFRRFQKQQQWQRWATLLNLFYIKIPLLDPDRFLSRLAAVGRVLFHPASVSMVVLAVLGAVGLVLTRWDDFLARLPSYQQMFTWHNMLLLWLALGLVKVLHELGHGLCSKSVGGHVQEMGVVLLFFFPTLYCNVTDSWTQPQKWKRMAISAAGIYVELMIAALATFLWWGTDPNTFVHNLCFCLILVCSVHTLLFNANPLMRFDGYFILSDWMEIPNLAQAANRQLKNTLMHWLGMAVPGDSAAGPKRFLAAFGIASLGYRCLVLGGTLYLGCLFLEEQRLPWLGLAFVIAGLFGVLAMPGYRLVRTMQQSGGLATMKRSRVLLTLGVMAAVMLVVMLVPFRMTVRGVGLLQVDPSQQERLSVPAPGGFLEQLLVRDGQPVQQGDVVAVLKNPDLEMKLRLNEAEQVLRTEHLLALTAQRYGRTESSPLHGEEGVDEINHHLRALVQEHKSLKSQCAAMTLRAPRDGILMGLPSWETKGKWLDQGAQLAVVGDARTLRVLVLLEPADRQLLKEGKQAWFLTPGNGVTWPGAVSEVAQVDVQAIPPQLSSRVGGEVTTRHDAVHHTEQPHKQHFLMSIALQNGERSAASDPRLQVGALGPVRVDAGTSTLGWRLRRFVGSTFHWPL